jgi:hypothetical protein
MLAHSEVPAWQPVDLQIDSQARLDRAGHTATVLGTSICIAGGRRGWVVHDLLVDSSCKLCLPLKLSLTNNFMCVQLGIL